GSKSRGSHFIPQAEPPLSWSVVSYADAKSPIDWRKRMLDRRDFMRTCSGMGLAGSLFPVVLWAQVEAQGAKKITREMIDNAATIADVAIADESREMKLEELNDRAKGYEEIYKLHIPNSVGPALVFDPVLPGMRFETARRPMRMSRIPSVAARK